MITPEAIERVRIRSKGKCEYCGDREVYGNPLEFHHALLHRSKNKPELDIEFNIMAVHKHPCHSRANSYAARKAFWQKQCAYYGAIVMKQWWESIPSKSRKEKFD